jgi:hypothetical protein
MIRAAFSNWLQPGKSRSQHNTMMFKTISDSVYGIDAYLVEVEVDVGTARRITRSATRD